MAVLWVFDDFVLADKKQTQPKQTALEFPSACCNAPMRMHWPCNQRAECTKCGECAICGGPNFEADAIREHERRRKA